MIDFDHQVLKLTNKFYRDYSGRAFQEILRKKDRPYNCLLIQTHYDYFICIPYRTEIHHDYAYKFSKSVRSSAHDSGLDYTKIIIVKDRDYINSESALIDKDEYNETMQNLNRIVKEALEFVEDYVNHCKKINLLHSAEFRRRYSFSTLKYFHKELGI